MIWTTTLHQSSGGQRRTNALHRFVCLVKLVPGRTHKKRASIGLKQDYATVREELALSSSCKKEVQFMRILTRVAYFNIPINVGVAG